MHTGPVLMVAFCMYSGINLDCALWSLMDSYSITLESSVPCNDVLKWIDDNHIKSQDQAHLIMAILQLHFITLTPLNECIIPLSQTVVWHKGANRKAPSFQRELPFPLQPISIQYLIPGEYVRPFYSSVIMWPGSPEPALIYEAHVFSYMKRLLFCIWLTKVIFFFFFVFSFMTSYIWGIFQLE